MAGFLATYVMLGKLAKSKTGCFNIPLAYFHRWYRLVPALALTTLIIMFLFPHLVKGPLAGDYYNDAVYPKCTKYWWPNLIFINNFYPLDSKNMCLG